MIIIKIFICYGSRRMRKAPGLMGFPGKGIRRIGQGKLVGGLFRSGSARMASRDWNTFGHGLALKGLYLGWLAKGGSLGTLGPRVGKPWLGSIFWGLGQSLARGKFALLCVNQG